MTNQEVFDYAVQFNTIVDDWACDVNPMTGEMESNAGVESLVYVEGFDSYYSVIHTSDMTCVLDPESDAVAWTQEQVNMFMGIDDESRHHMDLAEADEISLIDDAELDAKDDTEDPEYPFK